MPQCQTCGSQVPEHADVCPDCGMEMKNAPASTPGIPPPTPAPVPTPRPTSPPAPAPAGSARVILKRGGTLTSESFPVWERVVLGRFDPDTGPVDIDLGALPEAVYVSRRHAEMWPDTAGQWFIKDLGAGNGTFVRAQGHAQFQRVTGEQAINNGDEMALGNARFAFHVG